MILSVPMLLPYSGKSYVEQLDFSETKIQLTWRAIEEILWLVGYSRSINRELSWVGRVPEPKQQGVYQITEVRALAQKCSGVETTLDAVEIGRLANQWISECGGNYNPLKFWGHCHPGPCVAPSSQDNHQMSLFLRGQVTPPFFIRGIFAIALPAISGRETGMFYPGNCNSGCMAEFTIFYYDQRIAIRNAPWQIVDERDEKTFLKSLVRKRGG